MAHSRGADGVLVQRGADQRHARCLALREESVHGRLLLAVTVRGRRAADEQAAVVDEPERVERRRRHAAAGARLDRVDVERDDATPAPPTAPCVAHGRSGDDQRRGRNQQPEQRAVRAAAAARRHGRSVGGAEDADDAVWSRRAHCDAGRRGLVAAAVAVTRRVMDDADHARIATSAGTSAVLMVAGGWRRQ